MSHVRNEASRGTTSQLESGSPQRSDIPASVSGTLRLRGENTPAAAVAQENVPNRHVRWSEDVVDNEGMGKKSSKVCCIYHKARPVGESSSESDSSDSSSSDSDYDVKPDDDTCGEGKPATHGDDCNHLHTHKSRRGRSECSHNSKTKKGRRQKPSPNAYEKMPKTVKDR